jgi:diguanylate cyclase (GGDEF)-like protein
MPLNAEQVHTRRHAMALGAGLFAGGALLTFATMIAPHPPQLDVAGAWLLVLACAVMAAIFWLGRDGLPFGVLFVGILIGTLMISSGVYINGERDGGAAALNELYYVWPVIFSAYYFSVRVLAMQIAFVAACYAGVLLLVHPGPIGVTRWLIVVTMVMGVGGLISRLQVRVNDLVERLSDAARRDSLTGLLNRRGFEERLEGELGRATRSERPIGLILGDIDRFKTVNDRLGHPAGDAVLLRVASLLKSVGRRADTVARLGGEEFIFIVPDADAEMAFELAERARLTVEQAFAVDALPLTISFGTVAFPADGTTAGSLLESADRALYAAKNAGRNRSARATELLQAS